MKISKGFQSYSADTTSVPKFKRGHNSNKDVGGVTVLILNILLNDVMYLY